MLGGLGYVGRVVMRRRERGKRVQGMAHTQVLTYIPGFVCWESSAGARAMSTVSSHVSCVGIFLTGCSYIRSCNGCGLSSSIWVCVGMSESNLLMGMLQ